MTDFIDTGKRIICTKHYIENCKICSTNKIISKDKQTISKDKRSKRVRDKVSIFERFHNFGVKFVAVVDWAAKSVKHGILE